MRRSENKPVSHHPYRGIAHSSGGIRHITGRIKLGRVTRRYIRIITGRVESGRVGLGDPIRPDPRKALIFFCFGGTFPNKILKGTGLELGFGLLGICGTRGIGVRSGSRVKFSASFSNNPYSKYRNHTGGVTQHIAWYIRYPIR